MEEGKAYGRALEEARSEFARGRPEVMAESAGVRFVREEDSGDDGGMFFVGHLAGELGVSFPQGIVSHDGAETTVALMVVVLHYLARSAGPLELDDPVRFAGLPGSSAYAGAFRSHAEVPLMERFGEDGQAYLRAVRILGGKPVGGGDAQDSEVLQRLPFLPYLPIGVRLGLAEEGLPPECVIVFPRRAGYIQHVEDLAIAGEILSADLLAASERIPASEEGMTDGDLVVLATLYDPTEAEIVVSRLRSADIQATIRHDALSVVYGLTVDGLGKQEILVRAGDLEEAEAALEAGGAPEDLSGEGDG